MSNATATFGSVEFLLQFSTVWILLLLFHVKPTTGITTDLFEGGKIYGNPYKAATDTKTISGLSGLGGIWTRELTDTFAILNVKN